MSNLNKIGLDSAKSQELTIRLNDLLADMDDEDTNALMSDYIHKQEKLSFMHSVVLSNQF